MLTYQNIYAVQSAQERLRQGYRWGFGHHTKDSDALLVFTQGQEAKQDAQRNLDFCLDTGRRYHADYLVLHNNMIQFVGQRIREGVMDALAPGAWRQEYMTWSDSRGIDSSTDYSGRGELYSLRPWRKAFADSSTRGIYEVATGKRIKNRQDIIERFWSLGYATWRGRPPRVASVRWSGNREELEMLTSMAEKYWYRRHQSNVAKKMCSAYTSINRYAAWPGAW
jgi:hypothetical protein